jgi:hypothetical protein
LPPEQISPGPGLKNEFAELVRMLYDLANCRPRLLSLKGSWSIINRFSSACTMMITPAGRDLEQFKTIIGDYKTLQEFLDDASLIRRT